MISVTWLVLFLDDRTILEFLANFRNFEIMV